MKLTFKGSIVAELFSSELEKSLKGTIDLMLIKDETRSDCGFIPASLPGYFWDDTMWTRDAGTYLRELVNWGYIKEASLIVSALLRYVDKNDDGYYLFPRFFYANDKKFGYELDGTGSILIAFVMLYRALPNGDEVKDQIKEFFLAPSSPIFYILNELDKKPLLAGDGEFGGGCGIKDLYINSVQNNLLRLCLISCSDVYRKLGHDEVYTRCLTAARKIEENILCYLVDKDGTFIWCIDKETMKPDREVLEAPVNFGCGLINGILSMTSDVYGLSLDKNNFYAWENANLQFEKLYQYPSRRKAFDEYGVWAQFNDFRPGATSPSYGQGYAMQCMLLLDRMEMFDKALNYLANETYAPISEFDKIFKRPSPYYFYERCYSPYSIEKELSLEIGCGPLNLVCVSEPLKIGRMIAGFDFTGDTPVLQPRLPESITAYTAQQVPIPFEDQLFYADIHCRRITQGFKIQIKISDGVLPKLILRRKDRKDLDLTQVTNIEVEF